MSVSNQPFYKWNLSKNIKIIIISMTDYVTEVENLIKQQKFKEAIEIAKREADKNDKDEYTYRSMIGEAILKEH